MILIGDSYLTVRLKKEGCGVIIMGWEGNCEKNMCINNMFTVYNKKEMRIKREGTKIKIKARGWPQLHLQWQIQRTRG